MTRPEAGDVPSLAAASEKYSIASDAPRGDDGAWSFGDLPDLSDIVRVLVVDLPPGDLAAGMLKKGVMA